MAKQAIPTLLPGEWEVRRGNRTIRACGSAAEAAYWATRLNREEIRAAPDLRAYADEGDLEGLTELLRGEMSKREETLWALGGKEPVRQMPPWASDRLVDFFVKMRLSSGMLPFRVVGRGA